MWIDVRQNTEEWLDLRIGKVGGSSIGCVMANFGKAFGDPAKRLAMKIAYEQITGTREEETGFSNAHTVRGHEQEPLAREEYEYKYFCTVTNGGFFDCGNVGVSPDGLVSVNGIIEIKSEIRTVHGEIVRSGGFNTSYRWQFMLNLKASKREWLDYVSYCASLPEENRLYEYRFYAEDCKEEFKMIDERLEQFFCLVENVKADLLKTWI